MKGMVELLSEHEVDEQPARAGPGHVHVDGDQVAGCDVVGRGVDDPRRRRRVGRELAHVDRHAGGEHVHIGVGDVADLDRRQAGARDRGDGRLRVHQVEPVELGRHHEDQLAVAGRQLGRVVYHLELDGVARIGRGAESARIGVVEVGAGKRRAGDFLDVAGARGGAAEQAVGRADVLDLGVGDRIVGDAGGGDRAEPECRAGDPQDLAVGSGDVRRVAGGIGRAADHRQPGAVAQLRIGHRVVGDARRCDRAEGQRRAGDAQHLPVRPGDVGDVAGRVGGAPDDAQGRALPQLCVGDGVVGDAAGRDGAEADCGAGFAQHRVARRRRRNVGRIADRIRGAADHRKLGAVPQLRVGDRIVGNACGHDGAKAECRARHAQHLPVGTDNVRRVAGGIGRAADHRQPGAVAELRVAHRVVGEARRRDRAEGQRRAGDAQHLPVRPGDVGDVAGRVGGAPDDR